MKMDLDEALVLSFCSFLLRRKINFERNGKTIVFCWYSLNNSEIILEFHISKEGIVINASCDSEIRNKNELLFVINIINIFASNFFVFVESNANELFITTKTTFIIDKNYLIDEQFWSNLIEDNIGVISNVEHFINNVYFSFKSSTNFNYRISQIDDDSLSEFCFNSMQSFEKGLESYKNFLKNNKKQKKISYEEKLKNMSKEELNKELDYQLDIYKKDKSNEKELKLISKFLK